MRRGWRRWQGGERVCPSLVVCCLENDLPTRPVAEVLEASRLLLFFGFDGADDTGVTRPQPTTPETTSLLLHVSRGAIRSSAAGAVER